MSVTTLRFIVQVQHFHYCGNCTVSISVCSCTDGKELVVVSDIVAGRGACRGEQVPVARMVKELGGELLAGGVSSEPEGW
ncbi:hypothetical protein E2C01_045999 [Portunus trituberculatus]|uniref:Uncharacterized protein n=1 Tax=Portunus trituberculatus TaxID=210409 RepID=A0A5B7G3L9_PORTR|nr:hypothetical protein [Portunus trituberculatus]